MAARRPRVASFPRTTRTAACKRWPGRRRCGGTSTATPQQTAVAEAAAAAPADWLGQPPPPAPSPLPQARFAAKIPAARSAAADGGNCPAVLIRGGPLDAGHCTMRVLGVVGPQLVHPFRQQPPVVVVHIHQQHPQLPWSAVQEQVRKEQGVLLPPGTQPQHLLQ
jgi:hypothetical protein